jgi:putative transcriptional regulator
MQVKNRLAVLMAEKGIRSVSELHRRIKDKELTMSRRTLDKFYNNESNRIDYDTIATLCVILECSIGDLLELEETKEEGEG